MENFQILSSIFVNGANLYENNKSFQAQNLYSLQALKQRRNSIIVVFFSTLLCRLNKIIIEWRVCVDLIIIINITLKRVTIGLQWQEESVQLGETLLTPSVNQTNRLFCADIFTMLDFFVFVRLQSVVLLKWSMKNHNLARNKRKSIMIIVYSIRLNQTRAKRYPTELLLFNKRKLMQFLFSLYNLQASRARLLSSTATA